MNKTTLQEALRSRRKELGMTQEDVSKKIGQSESWYGKIEKGEILLQNQYVCPLAEVLGMDPIQIVQYLIPGISAKNYENSSFKPSTNNLVRSVQTFVQNYLDGFTNDETMHQCASSLLEALTLYSLLASYISDENRTFDFVKNTLMQEVKPSMVIHYDDDFELAYLPLCSLFNEYMTEGTVCSYLFSPEVNTTKEEAEVCIQAYKMFRRFPVEIQLMAASKLLYWILHDKNPSYTEKKYLSIYKSSRRGFYKIPHLKTTVGDSVDETFDILGANEHLKNIMIEFGSCREEKDRNYPPFIKKYVYTANAKYIVEKLSENYAEHEVKHIISNSDTVFYSVKDSSFSLITDAEGKILPYSKYC